jgi:hypothetical protein
MNLNSVRLIKYSSSEPLVWAVHQGKGHLRHFWCLTDEPSRLEDFKKSILFAIFNQRNAEIKSVSIEISDNGGHVWKIERTENFILIQKDNQHLDAEEGESEFRLALVDGDQLAAKSLSFSDLEIENGGEKLFGQHRKRGHTSQSQLERQVEEANVLALKKCEEIFGCRLLLQSDEQFAALSQLESVYLEFQSLKSHVDFLEKKSLDFKPTEDTPVSLIQQQLQIIHKIESLVGDLDRPNQTIQDLSETILNLEQALAESLEVCHCESLPKVEMVDEFENLINTLCRKKAYEKLLTYLMESRKKLESNIEPIFVSYHTTLESALIKDMDELEHTAKSLNFAAVQTSNIEIQILKKSPILKRVKKQLNGWLDNFKSATSLDNQETESLHTFVNSGDKLKEIAISVSHARSHLRELYHTLNSQECTHQELMSRIDQLYEKQIYQYSEIKKNWHQLAHQYNLSEDLTIKQLVTIIIRFSSIFEIHREITATKQQIKDRHLKLAQLSELVVEWKQITNSQKPFDAANSAILISEAKSILRYKGDRSKALANITAMASKKDTWHDIYSFTTERVNQCRLKAGQIAQALMLPAIDLNQEKTKALIEFHRSMSAMKSLLRSEKAQDDNVLFSASKQAQFFNVWRSPNTFRTLNQEQQFFRDLQNHHSNQSHLILIEPGEIAQKLFKLGIGQVKYIESPTFQSDFNHLATTERPPLKQHLTIGKGPNVSPAKKDIGMDQKTRELLEIFNGKKNESKFTLTKGPYRKS